MIWPEHQPQPQPRPAPPAVPIPPASDAPPAPVVKLSHVTRYVPPPEWTPRPWSPPGRDWAGEIAAAHAEHVAGVAALGHGGGVLGDEATELLEHAEAEWVQPGQPSSGSGSDASGAPGGDASGGDRRDTSDPSASDASAGAP